MNTFFNPEWTGRITSFGGSVDAHFYVSLIQNVYTLHEGVHYRGYRDFEVYREITRNEALKLSIKDGSRGLLYPVTHRFNNEEDARGALVTIFKKYSSAGDWLMLDYEVIEGVKGDLSILPSYSTTGIHSHRVKKEVVVCMNGEIVDFTDYDGTGWNTEKHPTVK